MTASEKRPCPGCGQERFIAEFRDVDDVRKTWAGRPPKFCRYCREKSPALQKRQRSNIARRESAVQKQTAYARRTEEQRIRDMNESHPDGTKHCPQRSGCDRDLPLSHFRTSIWQKDGLLSVCEDCAPGYPQLRGLS